MGDWCSGESGKGEKEVRGAKTVPCSSSSAGGSLSPERACLVLHSFPPFGLPAPPSLLVPTQNQR